MKRLDKTKTFLDVLEENLGLAIIKNFQRLFLITILMKETEVIRYANLMTTFLLGKFATYSQP